MSKVSNIGPQAESERSNPFSRAARKPEQAYSFVSDFHDTLFGGKGIHPEYLKALIKLQSAGHHVVIASGDPDNATVDIQDDEAIVNAVFDELGLNEGEKSELRNGLLKVTDKMKLKGMGLLRPDVFCDDDTPITFPKVHLDPNSDEFDTFVELANLNPDLAIKTLVEGNGLEDLQAELEVMKDQQQAYEKIRQGMKDCPVAVLNLRDCLRGKKDDISDAQQDALTKVGILEEPEGEIYESVAALVVSNIRVDGEGFYISVDPVWPNEAQRSRVVTPEGRDNFLKTGTTP